ncbi:hypothetical protein MN032_18250 [Agromyces atrinae]|uniref:Putative membrane protein n=1 Tax=Agromyces atrinae TaxID=592376 RepID=A0A4Q2M2H0_9MICO|nr:hypothetical protein [Agromyces atrinae]MCI2959630.1 hypothetical protein [Agromyces atrinae]NYD68580.1 putative membrane protein [Agromyces atrinae]RXZ85958.1 hypothetical protein ESP50_12160 [Agromyces atrinae]
MNVVVMILLILHFVGLASLLGGFLVQTKAIGRGKGTVVTAMVHGALTQLVTGVAMVGLIEMMGERDLDMAKIAVKLIVAVVITVLVFVFRKKDPAPSWALWLIGGLTLANIVIAVVWR